MTAITCAGCKHAYADTALFCPNCGRPKVREAVNDALVGKLLGERFQVQELIGQGGSGTIYRAEHVTLRRKVAIKVLHDELSRDDLAVERFRREATTVAEIDNEHIVEIHDFGRTPDGRLYLAMELLEGETLDTVLLRERTLSVERAADILIQVGEALMEAHAIGYVHRDLRPRNLYLAVRRGKANFVKLLDFGLAKLVETDASAASTSLGMTFGDPRYMSPEQARGDRIDRRADIYQLGCVAYEMLTGAPPFSGTRVFDILTKQVTEAPAPLPTRRPGVPLWMEAAVAKMLAKDSENRFATTTRMVEALRRGLETGEVMEDEVARRRESIPPPSVSRVMQRMGIAPEALGTPAPALPNLPAVRSAETKPMPSVAEPPAAKEAQIDAKATQRGLPPAQAAKVPDSVELLRKRTGTPRLGIPIDKIREQLPVDDTQHPVAGTIDPEENRTTLKRAEPMPRPRTPTPPPPAPAPTPGEDLRRTRRPDEEALDDARTVKRAPSEPLPEVRARRPSEPAAPVAEVRAKRATDAPMDRTRRATDESGMQQTRAKRVSSTPQEPVRPKHAPEPSGRLKRPTGEPGVSQAWYDEGDAASDEADGRTNTHRARKLITPSATDLSLYDELPRRRWGLIVGAIAFVLVGGIAIAVALNGNGSAGDSAASATPAPVANSFASVDAAPSVVIEPDAAPAPAVTPEPTPTTPAVKADPKAGEPKRTSTTPSSSISKTSPGKTSSSPGGFVPPGGDEIRRPGGSLGTNPTPPKDNPVVITTPKDPPKDPGPTGVSGRDGPVDPYNTGGGGTDTAPPTDGATPEKKAEFFANLGTQQLINGDAANAAANFKKAIELDGKNVAATIGMGEIALRAGLFGDAIAHLRKAAKAAPRSSRVFTLLGEAYLSSGNNAEAANNFKKALQLDPDNARARDGYNEASSRVPPPSE